MESTIIILKNLALALFGMVLFVLFYVGLIQFGMPNDPFTRNAGFLSWSLYISFKMSQELYYGKKN